MKKCYISAPHGVPLKNIKSILNGKGIDLINPSEFYQGGFSILEKTSDAIADADLFIAILDKSRSNANTLFELGLAYAKNKMILVLVPSGMSIPSDISELLYIKAGVDNIEAIDFALDQLLSAPKTGRRTKKSNILSSQPLGPKANNLLSKINKFGENIPEHELANIVKNMLEASQVSVIAQPKINVKRGDLAIWSEELEPILDNPILIEIKSQIDNKQQLNRISDQIENYLKNNNTRFALLLYLGDLPQNEVQSNIRSPYIISFQLQDLLKKLNNNSFGDVVRTTRNVLAHGGK